MSQRSWIRISGVPCVDRERPKPNSRGTKGVGLQPLGWRRRNEMLGGFSPTYNFTAALTAADFFLIP